MRELDTTVNTRVRLKEREAIRAVAKARDMTTGQLVREALDQWVIKSGAGAPLTPEVREQVADRVEDIVDTEIEKSAAYVPGQVAKEIADLPKLIAVLEEKLRVIEAEVGIVSPD